MKPKIRKQKIRLNNPIGMELIRNISTLVEVQLDLGENHDIVLKVGFNEMLAYKAVEKFLIRSVKDRTIPIDPNIEHSLTIQKKTKTVQPVSDNNFGLTTRQNQIMNLISKGKPDKEVAEILGIKLNTVKAHTKRIHIIYRVTNRIEAVLEYLSRTGRLIESRSELMLTMSQLGCIDSLN
jgi:DNA-binding CsgD family transcriptional regulator